MRYLGLDLGTTTLGLSISDKTNTIATPLYTLKFSPNDYESTLKPLEELVNEKKITDFVLGLPKNMNNTVGPRAESSMAYGEKIKELFSLPVEYQDERLTTVQAERMLVEQANTSRAKRKKVIDKLAAVMILQNYLDGSGKHLF